jgi:2,3-bisphosphoglycerate-independent phosphoglycerate mutase
VVEKLAAAIREIDGVKVTFYPGKEHRFVVVFSGAGLTEQLPMPTPSRKGPHAVGGLSWARRGKDGAVANAFIRKVSEV